MHCSTVLGYTNKEPVNQNSAVMYCERRFFTSLFSPTLEWRITNQIELSFGGNVHLIFLKLFIFSLQ